MYSWIDDIVLGLKDSCKTDDVYELYDELNIIIRRIEPSNILLQGNDSLYTRGYLDSEFVLIRNDLDENLERFILFHELGHALLHVDVVRAAFNQKCLNKHKLEKQANYFALKMLNLKFDSIEMEGMTLEQIASYMQIPYEPLLQLSNL
ncbi:MAG: PTS N-acetylglucosamine transporter subunit IIABC [Clostridium cadaveris]|uniref:PTS N-acetylglucosamine transporter subunit IIABC n=1 Tax=Clostridium cadaveris TaxID=1529 RepID=A0A316M7E5_9CLOT|nr:MAG: PTS N-acetylglucosamine transporter subunit IIABC [Clostridium cadaveris]